MIHIPTTEKCNAEMRKIIQQNPFLLKNKYEKKNFFIQAASFALFLNYFEQGAALCCFLL